MKILRFRSNGVRHVLVLPALIFCLVFLYSCGDSSKEVKAVKKSSVPKSEIPAPAPPITELETKVEPAPEPKGAVEPSAKPGSTVEPAPEPETSIEPPPESKDVVEPSPEPKATVESPPEPKRIGTVAKQSGKCPQPRKTKNAPSNIANRDKTGGANAENGRTIYEKTAKPMACKMCHGDNGDGTGKLGAILTPPPRNFTCAETMKPVSAGQMFWITKNGSPGTGMVAHGKTLKDNDIWDVVKFIRSEHMR